MKQIAYANSALIYIFSESKSYALTTENTYCPLNLLTDIPITKSTILIRVAKGRIGFACWDQEIVFIDEEGQRIVESSLHYLTPNFNVRSFNCLILNISFPIQMQSVVILKTMLLIIF